MKCTASMGREIFSHGISFPKILSNMSFLPYTTSLPWAGRLPRMLYAMDPFSWQEWTPWIAYCSPSILDIWQPLFWHTVPPSVNLDDNMCPVLSLDAPGCSSCPSFPLVGHQEVGCCWVSDCIAIELRPFYARYPSENTSSLSSIALGCQQL